MLLLSCNVGPLEPKLSTDSDSRNSVSVVGNYLLTEFNSSVPVDINLETNFSINLRNEINCFLGSYIKVNANNTFGADQKGIDIELEGTTEVFF